VSESSDQSIDDAKPETDGKFEARLEAVLVHQLPSCESLISTERLSGGASQETYRLLIKDTDSPSGQRELAIRRATGGVKISTSEQGYPGIATEAMLMQYARAAGVPEPEIYYVLTETDGLGEGFIMEWLEGEALGARVVRSKQFDAIRPTLAYECGKAMARIHNIDLGATGLAQELTVIPPANL